MATGQGRYLEEVDLGSEPYQQLAGTWVGEEEEHDGLSKQQERLVLNEEGTFTHLLAHHMGRLENDNCESSCSGRWRLHNIRHLGADLAAPAHDREVVFERGAESGPLLTERLVICGANPAVNGFVGMHCRLYPARGSNAENQHHSRRHNSSIGRRSSNSELEANELEVEDPEPNEADAKQLAEATGCSVDACFAALLQAGGVREEAAVLLLENPDNLRPAASASTNNTSLSNSASPSQPSSAANNANAAAVAEASGRSLAECREALRLHDDQVDDAVLYLLSLPPKEEGSEVASTSSAAASSSAQVAAKPQADESIKAARLTELTGQSYPVCLEKLRQLNGDVEAAGAALLGLEEVVAGTNPEASVSSAQDVPDETADLADTGIDAAGVPLQTHNGDLRASADVEAAVNAEVDAAMDMMSTGTGDRHSSPSPKRRRV